MIQKFLLLALCGIALIGTSCAKSSDDAPAAKYTPDSERAIGEPRFSFSSDQQEMKMSGLSRSEISELLMCKVKSTKYRTDKKSYSVTYGTVTRELENGVPSVQSERIDYTTENRDEVYVQTTSLTEHVVAGQNILASGPISYKDTCSASSGCDQEKREFISGSPRLLIESKTREEAILENLKKEKGSFECSMRGVTEDTDLLQKGEIKVGDDTYKAVQFLRKKTGKVYCRTGISRKDYFLGTGYEVSKGIILMDELLIPKRSDLSRLNINEFGCSRTPIFFSTEIKFEEQTISGSSFELVDYKLTGETLSLEAWNKKQDTIRIRVSELSSDLSARKARQDSAQLSVNEAETKLAAAESALAAEKAKLNEAIASRKPDEDVYRKFVKDAEVSVESARAHRDKAKEFYALSQTQVKSAQDALNAYINENGTGEN